MIDNTVAKAVDLREVVGQRERRVLLVEIGQDFVNGWRDFEEEWMVDIFGETVERELKDNEKELDQLK